MNENKKISEEQFQGVGFMTVENPPCGYTSYFRALSKRAMRIRSRWTRRCSITGEQAYDLIHRDARAHDVVERCLKYGDRVPRKYYRKYSEAIKWLFPEHKA